MAWSVPTERARQTVHIAMGAWALLLRYITWWETALLAATALAFNRFVLPRVGGGRLFRETDHARGYSAGILLYPAAVLTPVSYTHLTLPTNSRV